MNVNQNHFFRIMPNSLASQISHITVINSLHIPVLIFSHVLLFSTAPKLTTMRTASAHDMNALHYEPDVDFDADAKMTTPMTHAHTGERAHGHDDVCFGFHFLFFCVRFLWLESNALLCLPKRYFYV